MYLFMNVYTCGCMHMCVSAVHVYVYMYVCLLCMYMYACMYVCVNVYMCACMCIYGCMCVCCACVCILMYPECQPSQRRSRTSQDYLVALALGVCGRRKMHVAPLRAERQRHRQQDAFVSCGRFGVISAACQGCPSFISGPHAASAGISVTCAFCPFLFLSFI